MNGKIDFKELNEVLLNRVESYCLEFISGGKRNGNEWTAGDVTGGKGDSFSLNMQTSLWADFATGEKGGDIISHYACCQKISQIEAARELQEWCGDVRVIPLPKKKEVEKIGFPPEGAPEPTFRTNGNPPAVWTYRDGKGVPVFYIQRVDREGGKDFYPTSWSLTQQKWVKKAYPEPRPLYGLELLTGEKHGVLVVEGEACVHAARELMDSAYEVVTWAGGAEAVEKTDWTPLYGRNVLLWPDADPPGANAMNKAEEKLNGNVLELKKVIPPTGTELHFDVKDALQAGWNTKKTVSWLRANVEVVKIHQEVAVVPEAVVVENEDPPAETVNVTIDDDFEPPDEQVIKMFQEADLDVNQKGVPAPNSSNVFKFLKTFRPDIVRYDEFHNVFLDENNKQWDETKNIDLMCFFQSSLKFRTISLQTIENAIVKVAHMNKCNEPKDWLKSLEWDGVPRVESFIQKAFGCDPTEYVKAVSRNFWISLAVRIMSPGEKVDNMMVLEGPQGSLKSMALEAIGGKWYAEINQSLNDKDFFLAIQGKVLCEIAELDAFNRSEVNTIKRVITSRHDRLRLPYAKTVKDYPRTCIFVGSTNDDNYLRDSTGARRFWPIRVRKIDIEYIKANRGQLFAEARVLFTEGFTWWEMPTGLTEYEQEMRRSYDEWESILSAYLKTEYVPGSGLTIHDLAKDALDISKDKLEKRTQMRIANCLKVLGWEKKKTRDGVKWHQKVSLTDNPETE